MSVTVQPPATQAEIIEPDRGRNGLGCQKTYDKHEHFSSTLTRCPLR